MKAEIELKTPSVPNFILHEGGTVSIADLSDEALREISEAWTESLLARKRQILAGRKTANAERKRK